MNKYNSIIRETTLNTMDRLTPSNTPKASVGLLTVGAGVSLTALPALRTLFFLLGCLMQARYEVFFLVLFYFVFFILVLFGYQLLEAYPFPEEEQSGNGSGGERMWKQELGEVEGGKLWSGYCMRENLFSVIKSLRDFYLGKHCSNSQSHKVALRAGE